MDENKDKDKKTEEEKPETKPSFEEVDFNQFLDELKKLIETGGTDDKEVPHLKPMNEIFKSPFGITPKVMNNEFLDVLFYLFLTMGIGLAINGFLPIYRIDNYLLFVAYLGIYGLLDYFVRVLMYKKMLKIYMKTLGFINIVLSFVTYVGTFYLFGFLFKFESSFEFVLLGWIIVFLVRYLIMKYLMDKRSKKVRILMGGKK